MKNLSTQLKILSPQITIVNAFPRESTAARRQPTPKIASFIPTINSLLAVAVAAPPRHWLHVMFITLGGAHSYLHKTQCSLHHSSLTPHPSLYLHPFCHALSLPLQQAAAGLEDGDKFQMEMGTVTNSHRCQGALNDLYCARCSMATFLTILKVESGRRSSSRRRRRRRHLLCHVSLKSFDRSVQSTDNISGSVTAVTVAGDHLPPYRYPVRLLLFTVDKSTYPSPPYLLFLMISFQYTGPRYLEKTRGKAKADFWWRVDFF